MSLNGSILFESYAPDGRERSYAFADPVGEVVAMEFSQVRQALVEVERAVGEGLHAAGFLCYEAAPGLDSALVAGGKGELPLVYFALCERREEGADRPGTGTYELGAWAPSVSRSDYETDIERIRAYIAAGDTYQVNYTLRLRSGFQGDARALYRDMCLAQEAAFCAYFDLGRHVLLSASPELFFRLREGRFTARPMKGTRPRGRWSEEDLQLAVELRESPKDRAENVMITDLLRNDLGRISEVGSVEVPALWEAERYPTVWQMTSTVESRLKAGVALPEIFAALFPCGSVTGAPKVRTMEIIAELEREPRGIYTGCMGYISPGNEACFNVAIRTAHLDRAKGQLEFGVGGGITWGSSPEGEYEECLVKARVLGMRRPKFELLETLLYEGRAYFLLERHLQRLAQSAEYWGYKCDADAVRAHLDDEANRMGDNSFRVRLLLKKEGDMDVECHALAAAQTLKVALADEAVDSGDPFLYHKTTHRAVYERQLSAHADCDDVVLYNERGELTECCIGNLVLEREGTRHTPPVSSGLLAGTFREWLLERGEIREKVLKIGDLERSDALYLISSVRRWVALELV